MLGREVITYRSVTPDDVDVLEALDSDPEVMRYLSGGAPTPRATIIDAFIPRMLSQATRPGLGFFIVLEDDVPLGWAHLRNDTFEPAWAEVGYRLFRHAWGRGVATRRAMEKAGLVYAGDFTFPGRELPGMSIPPMPGVLYLKRARIET